MSDAQETLKRIRNGNLPVDFNWNVGNGEQAEERYIAEPTAEQVSRVTLVSECLRDGLHGVKRIPDPRQQLEYAKKLYKLGIRRMTVGIYSGSQDAENCVDRSIKQLLSEMRVELPDMIPAVLTLATEESLKWTIKCHEINPSLRAWAFMGSAPSRMLVEGWTPKFVMHKMKWLIEHLRQEDIVVMAATEHTTQTPPNLLREIIQTQADAGISHFAIADTIGVVRPIGAARVTSFVRKTLDDMGKREIKIDWHGHRDLGNELGNAMAAIAEGAEFIHVVSGGIGERAGNLPLELMVINLSSILQEARKQSLWNLDVLNEVVEFYRELADVKTPEHGVMGLNAFKTSLGIHAAAILKTHLLALEAELSGEVELASRLRTMERTIYSALDPDTIGRNQEIAVSPWSSKKTIELAAKLREIKVTDDQVEHVLQTVRALGRELSDVELMNLLELSAAAKTQAA